MTTASLSTQSPKMFRQLLDNPTGREPGPLQAEARKHFPSVVKQSHFEVRFRGAPIPNTGKYVIIGVATYAPDDLKLLDDVNATHAQWQGEFTIAVFDMLECKDLCDVQNYVPSPSFGPVVQTPLVAFWDKGSPLALQVGLHKSREILRQTGVLK